MITDKDEILAGAKEVFFAANLDGYVGNGERSIVTKTPDGYTTIEFEEGDYRVVDRYCTTPQSDKSAGTTTIFHKDIPIWWMCYGGSYPPEVIPFLKAALKEAYQRKQFQGGRGPTTFSGEEGLIYFNTKETTANFQRFEGEERIHRRGSSSWCLGTHKYWGMSLI